MSRLLQQQSDVGLRRHLLVTVMLTHSLSEQPGEAMASLRYTAPSFSSRLALRSRISRVGFCFSTSARWRMPSRVTRLLWRCGKMCVWGGQGHAIDI